MKRLVFQAPEGNLLAESSINCTSSVAKKSGICTVVGKRASNEGSIRATRAKPWHIQIFPLEKRNMFC